MQTVMITELEAWETRIRALIDLVFGKPTHCVFVWWRGEPMPLSLLLSRFPSYLQGPDL